MDSANDRHIWGAQYNEKMANLLDIQENISSEIMSNLRSHLEGAAEQRAAKHYTENNDAYQLYLKGLYNTEQFTQESVTKGIDYFHQAIAKDPNYALAHAGIAQAYFEVSSQYLPPREAMPKLKEAASRALSLDDSLAEAHTLMAMADAAYDHDYHAAEKEFQRGVQLNPGSPFVHEWYAYVLTGLARNEEAEAELKRAQDLDPLSDTVGLLYGLHYVFSDQFDRAVDESRKMIQADPNFWFGHFFLGWAQARKGNYEEAIKELERSHQTRRQSLRPGLPRLRLRQIRPKREGPRSSPTNGRSRQEELHPQISNRPSLRRRKRKRKSPQSPRTILQRPRRNHDLPKSRQHLDAVARRPQIPIVTPPRQPPITQALADTHVAPPFQGGIFLSHSLTASAGVFSLCIFRAGAGGNRYAIARATDAPATVNPTGIRATHSQNHPSSVRPHSGSNIDPP